MVPALLSAGNLVLCLDTSERRQNRLLFALQRALFPVDFGSRAGHGAAARTAAAAVAAAAATAGYDGK